MAIQGPLLRRPGSSASEWLARQRSPSPSWLPVACPCSSSCCVRDSAALPQLSSPPARISNSSSSPRALLRRRARAKAQARAGMVDNGCLEGQGGAHNRMGRGVEKGRALTSRHSNIAPGREGGGLNEAASICGQGWDCVAGLAGMRPRRRKRKKSQIAGLLHWRETCRSFSQPLLKFPPDEMG